MDKKANKTTKSQPRKPKFIAYANREADRKRAMGRIGVANNYVCAARRFQAFLASRGKKDVSFKKMNPLLMADFQEWLHVQGCQRNTSATYLRSLRAVYGRAVKEGLTTGNPFEGTFRGVAKTKKRAIDGEDIRRLRELDIETYLRQDIRKQVPEDGKRYQNRLKRLLMARDLFIFCFCARGLTFVDLAFMKKTDLHDGNIHYARRKTGQHIDVHIEPLMLDIISRYPSATRFLFPILEESDDEERIYTKYLRSIHQYNKSLHQLGQMLGGLPLTSYVCRHSWATTAHRNNVSLPIISQALGHDSEKTTAIYLKSFETDTINAANHTLLDNVFGDKTC